MLQRLIDTLLRTAIEHAGAERGILLLPKGRELRIEAQATSGEGSITIDRRDLPISTIEMPESIVLYAARTQESVILDDASAHSAFAGDPYVHRKNARSILCPSVLHARSGLTRLPAHSPASR